MHFTRENAGELEMTKSTLFWQLRANYMQKKYPTPQPVTLRRQGFNCQPGIPLLVSNYLLVKSWYATNIPYSGTQPGSLLLVRNQVPSLLLVCNQVPLSSGTQPGSLLLVRNQVLFFWYATRFSFYFITNTIYS